MSVGELGDYTWGERDLLFLLVFAVRTCSLVPFLCDVRV